MPQLFDPRLSILSAPQREIWPSLVAAPGLFFVLYGGTAIALHLGHRASEDFDFFRAEPLDKNQLRKAFRVLDQATVLQDSPDTLVVLISSPSGQVKISFFGGLGFGRLHEPLLTRDRVLLVASLDDLMATKLKTTLDRAEAKDYRDISAMIAAGVSLPMGLGAFQKMFKTDASQVLRAIGYFKDGDLPMLPQTDQELLRHARDRIIEVPDVSVTAGSLATAVGADISSMPPRPP